MVKGYLRAAATCLTLTGVLILLATVGGFAQMTTTTQVTTSVVVQHTDYGIVDWTNGIIRVEGSAVAPKKGNIAQEKLLARRGAIVDGQRQLAEMVKGVYVEGETLMRDYMVVNDDVRSATEAFLKGVVPVPGSEVYTTESDGSMSCTVALVMYLRDLFEIIYRGYRDQFATVTTTVSVAPIPYTGLIVDIKGFPQYRKSAIFKVVTVSGQVLYGVNVASYEYACASRLASYINSVIDAKQRLQDRIGANPYVVTAVAIHGSDIVVSNDVASTILSLGPTLQQCKVVVVSN